MTEEIKLSRQEQETVIRKSAADKTWEVITSDLVIIRRMESRGYEPDKRRNPWGYVSYSGIKRVSVPKANAQKPSPRGFVLKNRSEKGRESRDFSDQNPPDMVGQGLFGASREIHKEDLPQGKEAGQDAQDGDPQRSQDFRRGNLRPGGAISRYP